MCVFVLIWVPNKIEWNTKWNEAISIHMRTTHTHIFIYTRNERRTVSTTVYLIKCIFISLSSPSWFFSTNLLLYVLSCERICACLCVRFLLLVLLLFVVSTQIHYWIYVFVFIMYPYVSHTRAMTTFESYKMCMCVCECDCVCATERESEISEKSTCHTGCVIHRHYGTKPYSKHHFQSL